MDLEQSTFSIATILLEPWLVAPLTSLSRKIQ